MMAPGSSGHEDATSSINPVDGQPPSLERMDEKNKTPRHPRWTRHETLVLIEGKRIAEERGRKGQIEPKWDGVSSYCRQNGVNRGPVQCRKRWSNLVSDFKKIKVWESQAKRGGDSFWTMRSDLKKERKLPGFFDHEIYDVLDGKVRRPGEDRLALVAINADESNGDGVDSLEVEIEDEIVEDEGGDNGLFPEFEQAAQEEIGRSPQEDKVQTDGKTKTIPSPVPISEMKYQPFHQTDSNKENKRQPGPHSWRAWEFQEGVKRRRQSSNHCQNINVEDLLMQALERNTKMLKEQLEDQKLNWLLDKQQRKEQHDILIASLTKITDALEKIANKL